MMRTKLALLTNFIPPYRLPFYSEISKRMSDVLFILNTKMERNRHWTVDWGNLNVFVSKSLIVKKKWSIANGINEISEVHIPFDILFLLIQYRPEFVISSEFGMRSLHALIYKLMYPRTKWLIWATLSERSEADRGKIRTLLRKWMIKFVDGVYVNGKSGKNYIIHLGLSSDRISIIPYTIDNRLFSAVYKPKKAVKPNKLLYSGQLIERKGLQYFLPSLREWCIKNQRNIEVNIVGDGPLKNWIKNFDSSDYLKITLYGGIDYPQLPEIYAKNHIFIFPTIVDEWGVVVNEALASGLPILGSQYSQAVEELIIEGYNGWIFQPDDRNSVHQALDRALNISETTFMDMQNQAIHSISHITPEKVSKKMIDFLGEV